MMMIIYLLLHDIYWVFPKKNHTPPTEEISPVQRGRGESYEECLKFVQDSHKGGGGGDVNYLHGGYRYFLEQPILWKHKKLGIQG